MAETLGRRFLQNVTCTEADRRLSTPDAFNVDDVCLASGEAGMSFRCECQHSQLFQHSTYEASVLHVSTNLLRL